MFPQENLGDLIGKNDDLAATSIQENDRLSNIIRKHSNQLKHVRVSLCVLFVVPESL